MQDYIDREARVIESLTGSCLNDGDGSKACQALSDEVQNLRMVSIVPGVRDVVTEKIFSDNRGPNADLNIAMVRDDDSHKYVGILAARKDAPWNGPMLVLSLTSQADRGGRSAWFMPDELKPAMRKVFQK